MTFTRYEILLPLCYNDGRRIEHSKFRQTNLDLLKEFSGTTVDRVVAIGAWKYRGTIYEDELLRIVVDVPSSVQADDFFRKFKEILKARFEQLDIWISRHELDIL